MDSIRTFIAVELPDNVKSAVYKIEDDLKRLPAKITWVAKDNIHITIKFLGNVAVNKFDELYYAVEEGIKNISPFTITLSNIGVFPDFKHPNVIWVGVNSGFNELYKIFNALENNLFDIGFPKEKRGFKSHITIGRVKYCNDSTRFEKIIKETSFSWNDSINVDSITVFKSTLTSKGSIYDVMRRIPLTKS